MAAETVLVSLRVVSACLPCGDGRSGSVISRPSHRLIQSARFSGSSHHLIVSSHQRGGTLFLFSPDPLPPALLGLLAWVCSPVPGRGMRGLRHGLRWRAGGLLACVLVSCSAHSAAARSLVAICPASLVSLLLSRGVVGHFAGYSDRFLVGVGVFKYMPLNRILWLLMGIFCDVVRCPFSAPPRRLVLAHLPCSLPSFCCGVMVLAWVFSCGELGETARGRPFVIGSFSASCVMGWTVLGSVCRAGLMASAGRCACLYRLALPLPLGAGDYVRPAGVGSACGEGVGGIVEVLPISWLVVVSSRRHRLSLLALFLLSSSSSPAPSLSSLYSRVVSYRFPPRSCD